MITKTTMTSASDRRRRHKWPTSILFLLLSLPIIIIFSTSSFASSDHAAGEIHQLNLKLSQLESTVDENTKLLLSKTQHMDKSAQLIQDLDRDIQFLRESLDTRKASESGKDQKNVGAMEEEIGQLWSISRRNNFNYHVLESKVHEEEDKVKALTSQVQKMENIITEQWVQIQQLEQALQTMKIMTSKVREKSKAKVHNKKSNDGTIFKFLKGVRHYYLPEVVDLPDAFFLGNYISKSSVSRAFGSHLKNIFSAARRWHHELQGLVKWAFETNEVTATLANEEVICFVASLIIVTIPIISYSYLLSPALLN